MKNVSRNNKLLLCFRPVVDMDQLVLESKSAVIDHGSRRRRPFNCINPENRSPVSESVKNLEKSMVVRRHPSNRTLSKVIKAVLFETILTKRVRDRKSLTQDSYQSSKRSFSRHTHKSLDLSGYCIQEKKSKPVLSSQSSVGSSSSSSSSSCSTSSISEPTKQSQDFKNQQERAVQTKPSKKDDNTDGSGSGSWSFCCVITLLQIILAVTCLWGRVYAIFCTTILLYCLPRRSKCRRRLPENEAKRLRKSEAGDYQKKRIIMEGLLERNHHRESALNT